MKREEAVLMEMKMRVERMETLLSIDPEEVVRIAMALVPEEEFTHKAVEAKVKEIMNNMYGVKM